MWNFLVAVNEDCSKEAWAMARRAVHGAALAGQGKDACTPELWSHPSPRDDALAIKFIRFAKINNL
ncbi:hypothetical protein SAE02_41770 [Skermanella aerolata]|uniref:Uncharacterized protein n=1 Tax=Skermanella aerolata TaxID=393310 RepID=A0A512DU78_9PROT|nr:hypothetical protein SAE02_41770 [Skermanella aerolata]